ncbi:hypothetical protein T10_3131 [Trichinella papuae]|uniref:Uncharacterized protein n=1 Tax=Trichinella papuae TaxID=268474 RepID=A0A0V1MIS6_9BILA|nr:hypothetical protein T10_3131 [Trichinella papuae]
MHRDSLTLYRFASFSFSAAAQKSALCRSIYGLITNNEISIFQLLIRLHKRDCLRRFLLATIERHDAFLVQLTEILEACLSGIEGWEIFQLWDSFTRNFHLGLLCWAMWKRLVGRCVFYVECSDEHSFSAH